MKVKEIPFDAALLGTPGITVGFKDKSKTLLELHWLKTPNTVMYPVFALWVDAYGETYSDTFTVCGRDYEFNDTPDLVMYREVKLEREYWCCVYRDGIGASYDSRRDAEALAKQNGRALGIVHTRVFEDGTADVEFINLNGEQ